MVDKFLNIMIWAFTVIKVYKISGYQPCQFVKITDVSVTASET
jgi:hypothetical protein